MNRRILLAFHLLAGASDTATGALLLAAPEFTLRLMQLHAPEAATVYLSFVGAFVLAVGLAYLYGANLVVRGECRQRLETVWLLTAFTRASVAVFVVSRILVGALEAGWLTVAVADGTLVLIQAVGLRKGWLASAAK
ncbi:MAG TPA: hypothetical protein VL967_04495 [Terracidiphilus sp.]|nr:hypothetical protein [Terracidiphilus sp.]